MVRFTGRGETMNAEREEQDRIQREIEEEGYCHECGVPVGWGWCDGCVAVAASTDYVDGPPPGLSSEHKRTTNDRMDTS